MKRLIPTRRDALVLLTMAVVCAAAIGLLPSVETALAAFTFPLILTATLMGARRGGSLGR